MKESKGKNFPKGRIYARSPELSFQSNVFATFKVRDQNFLDIIFSKRGLNKKII